jgi:site-specific DNA recombinase
VYCGRIRWNFRKLEGKRTYKEIVVPGKHEAIISEELFERIQAMRKRRSITREKTNSTYAFTGVLRCNRCGYSMIGVKQKRTNEKFTRYYKCLGRSNFGLCNMPNIQEGIIEQIFLAALKEDSEQFQKLLSFEEVKPQEESVRTALQNELEQIQKRKRKWQDAFANDAISLADLKTRNAEEKAKEEIIISKLQAAPEREKSSLNRKELLELIKSFADLWNSVPDDRAKKSFIQEVFSEIKIDSVMERGVIGGPKTYTPAHIVDWSLNI